MRGRHAGGWWGLVAGSCVEHDHGIPGIREPSLPEYRERGQRRPRLRADVATSEATGQTLTLADGSLGYGQGRSSR